MRLCPGLLTHRGIHRAMIRRALMALLMVIAAAFVFASTATAADQSNDYKLGPEDAITVTVVDHPEFSGDFYVPAEGTVTFPGAGALIVSDKTISELETNLKTRLVARGLRDPEVYVTVKIPRPLEVHVLGSVNKPGAYPLKPGWRITEALSAAGGLVLGIEPADCTVHVLQTNGTKNSVSLQEALRGSETSNLVLQAGDVMTVESVETFPVYVMGKVRSPGLYNIRKNSATVLSAITVAGGTLDDAALSKVTVTHLTGESETANLIQVTLDGKEKSPVALRSGDLIVVPDSTAKFAILGSVNAPGFFQIKENQTVMLSDAIGMAKGADPKNASLNKIAIVRTEGGKEERKIYDFGKFAKSGDMSQNPQIQSGDIVFVPSHGGMDLDRVFGRLANSLSIFWMLNRFNSD